MAINDIEMVCAGNSFRSRLLESFARYFSNLRAAHLKISSSGAYVNFLDTHSEPEVLDAWSKYLPSLKDVGLLASAEEQDLASGKNVKAHFRVIGDRVRLHEANIRARVLRSYGLDNYIDDADGRTREPRQTQVRPEAQLVLPVTDSVLSGVNEIYEGVSESVRPIIQRADLFAKVPISGEQTSFDPERLFDFGCSLQRVASGIVNGVLFKFAI